METLLEDKNTHIIYMAILVQHSTESILKCSQVAIGKILGDYLSYFPKSLS